MYITALSNGGDSCLTEGDPLQSGRAGKKRAMREFALDFFVAFSAFPVALIVGLRVSRPADVEVDLN